ncbi:MAG: hypothetical protein WD225_02685 [Ilumatobacteraceae bacterium]
MMRRITWFATGVAAGTLGANYAKRKVRTTAAQLAPGHVARTTYDVTRRRAHDLVEAVRDGREAMHAREDEMRARRDGRLVTLDEHLGPSDQVIVDGRPVEPGSVVVLRHAPSR